MIRKYHNHTLQTNPQNREEEDWITRVLKNITDFSIGLLYVNDVKLKFPWSIDSEILLNSGFQP